MKACRHVQQCLKSVDDYFQGSTSNRARGLCYIGIFVGALSASLVVGGCASRLGQFSDLSEAGVAYAEAMDKLLKESGALSIDADSAVLIESRSGLSSGYDGERDKRLDKHNKLLKERLIIISYIIRHGELLKSYFEVLGALASTNVGEDIASASNGIIAELGKLSPRIANAEFGDIRIGSLVEPPTRMVVAAFRQAALEKELRANAKTIERELALHTAAIRAVARMWKTDQKIIVEGKSIMNREQFVKNGPLPKSWAADRRSIIISDSALGLVDSAIKASVKLRKAFVKVVQKQVNIEDVLLLLRDLDDVRALVELVEKDPQG